MDIIRKIVGFLVFFILVGTGSMCLAALLTGSVTYMPNTEQRDIIMSTSILTVASQGIILVGFFIYWFMNRKNNDDI